MPVKQPVDYYRVAFESIAGEVSNRRWKQIRNELERSGVNLNIKSVQSYAQLKLNYPRTVLTKKAVQLVEDFQNKYQCKQEFLGEELLEELQAIKTQVSERMLINFFYKANLQFGKHNAYTLEESSKVIFFAAISRNK